MRASLEGKRKGLLSWHTAAAPGLPGLPRNLCTPRPTMLSRQDFLQVVRDAPLVSIDLIVRNLEGEVLLGLRNNRPAQGWWFVPGGIVRKNERFEQAFRRISQAE